MAGGVVFSPDSKRVAYGVKRGEKVFVVVDGVEGKEYNWVGWPAFSPNSQRAAYAMQRGGKWLVVVTG